VPQDPPALAHADVCPGLGEADALEAGDVSEYLHRLRGLSPGLNSPARHLVGLQRVEAVHMRELHRGRAGPWDGDDPRHIPGARERQLVGKARPVQGLGHEIEELRAGLLVELPDAVDLEHQGHRLHEPVNVSAQLKGSASTGGHVAVAGAVHHHVR